MHINTHVHFHNDSKKVTGIFKSIDSEGNALIDVDGALESFSSGIIEV